MAKDSDPQGKAPVKGDERAERLAAALRANLHRRKAQARAAQSSPADRDRSDD